MLSVIAMSLIAAHLLDAAAWEYLRDARVNEREWGRLLRSVGYVPTWIIGTAALWLASRSSQPTPPHNEAPSADGHSARLRLTAGVLLFAPPVAGGIAEVVKIAVRRQRPGAETVDYVFRPYDVDFWSTRGLGFASSHTAVAFAAAAVLARAFPATRPVWYLLATGCALTRVLAGAHYLSDTVAAAAIGWLTTQLLWQWAEARSQKHERRVP